MRSTVGTYRDGDHLYRVSVEARLEQSGNGREGTTIEHEPYADAWEFAVSADVYERPVRGGRWRDAMGGQCVEELLKVTNFAPGWDETRARELVELWNRWHLNLMKAGCAHQTVVYEDGPYGRRQPSLALTEPCPESGYRYGSAWLGEIIPDDVMTEIRRFV